MKYCRNCGVAAKDTVKFCENCGTAFLPSTYAAPQKVIVYREVKSSANPVNQKETQNSKKAKFVAALSGLGDFLSRHWKAALIILVLILFRYCGQDSPRPSSHYLTDGEAFYAAQEVVKGNLKAPSTAKFCTMSDANIEYLGDGQYRVTGWVDAQNGFGAMIRKTFIATFTEMKDSSGEVGFEHGKVTFVG